MKTSFLRLTLILALAAASFGGHAHGAVYYVATNGSDATGDGSAAKPWATITYALDHVPDGSTILVRPGDYVGRVRLRGNFAQGVTVRSEVPYQARLRNTTDKVITSYDGCHGVTLEGFDIAHGGPGAAALVVHLDGGGVSRHVSRITLRNNVLHDSYNNDILKINNAARQITIAGNMFYNQAGSDEHMDVNSATDVVIQDNIFFNDFAGSGRPVGDTSSFIVIKDSNGSSDGQLGSERVVVRRNVFLHWEGSSGQGFVRAGEDGTANYEARDVLIENNLLIGNNTQQIRSPFQVMGCYSVTIRANTVAGNMPAKEYGARIFTYGANPANDQVHLHNNIWSDPTGTMGDTFTRGGNTTHLTFDHNLFWNAGQPFPTSAESIVEVADDAHRIVGDPRLGSQAGLVLPRWNSGAGQFADGSPTVRQAFERLVTLYGTPAEGSPAIDRADPAYAPAEDILGRARPVGPRADVGAVERQGYGFTLTANPASRAIAPGGVAVYAIGVQPSGGFTASVSLVAVSPAPSLAVRLVPAVGAPPVSATLTVTDGHAGPLLPGLWYTVPVTATGGGVTRSTSVRLLVGGARLYLPLVSR